MDFTELNKPELIFECRLRNIEFQPTETVQQLRAKLAPTVSNPENFPLNSYSHNSITIDLDEISHCISILEACLSTFPSRKNKIPPYIAHIRTRLNLINLDEDLTPDQLNTFNSLANKLTQLQNNYLSLTQTPTTSQYHSATSLTNPQPVSPLLPNQNYFDTLTQKLINLTEPKYEKDLKRFIFRGDSCPINFIKNIEDFASIRNISQNVLYNHAYDILSGTALNWFQSRKNSISDWSSFKNLLIADFEIVNHDFNLKKVIENRKQNNNERVIAYFSAMENLFSKLHTPLSEPDKVDIFLRNLNPQYSMRFSQSDLLSVASLLESCKFSEKLLQVNSNTPFHPSHSSPLNQVHKQNDISPYIPSFPYSHNNVLAVKSTSPQIITFTCPRCRTNTHNLSDCTNTQKVCYRCGKKDFTVLTCPNCKITNSKN